MATVTTKLVHSIAIGQCRVEVAMIDQDPVDGDRLDQPMAEITIPAGSIVLDDHGLDDLADFLRSIADDLTARRKVPYAPRPLRSA